MSEVKNEKRQKPVEDYETEDKKRFFFVKIAEKIQNLRNICWKKLDKMKIY
jgi:hypothetical protein